MANFTLGSLAAHLAHAVGHQHAHTHHALEQAAERVERRAKQEIGTYQTGAGPFVSWAELSDNTKADRAAQGYSDNDPGLRTGDMRESIHHVVGDHEAVVGSDDENLVRFELGTVRQPPRSVLGLAAHTEGPHIARILGGSVKKTLFGEGMAAPVPLP